MTIGKQLLGENDHETLASVGTCMHAGDSVYYETDCLTPAVLETFKCREGDVMFRSITLNVAASIN
jgi:hypothetical protein